jgi:inosine/xanthosine triphosphate pyrophosphatase family protein
MDHDAHLPVTARGVAMRPVPARGSGTRAPRPVVYLHTGSDVKRHQYGYLLGELDLQIAQPADVPDKLEPQVEGCGAEAERVLVTTPLDAVAELVDRRRWYPFVVEDTMLFIEHFNRAYADEKILPGPDTKRWWRALGADGVLELMAGSDRRRARYVCQIGVLLGPGDPRVFRAEVDGSIAQRGAPAHGEAPAGDFPRSTFFHSIFVPDGATGTLASLDQDTFLRYDYRRRCLGAAAAPIRASARHEPDGRGIRPAAPHP